MMIKLALLKEGASLKILYMLLVSFNLATSAKLLPLF